MAAGLPDSVKLEIDFGSGYVDVTAYLALSDNYSVEVTRGRPTPYDDAGPSTLDMWLRNGDGRFTPDNPLSPYWPNVTEGLAIRFSVTKTAASLTSNRRFVGTTTGFEPSTPDGVIGQSVVHVTADDLLAQLGNRTVQSDFIEFAINRSTGSPFGPCDLFPFDDEAGVRNAGTGSPQRGYVVADATTAGTLTWSNTVEDGVLTDGQVAFNPTEDEVGPVVVLPLQATTSGNIYVLLKVKGDLPASRLTLFQVYRSTGTRAMDIGYTTAGHLEISDDGGVVDLTTFAIPADSWFVVSLTQNATFHTEATVKYLSPTASTTVGASPAHGRSLNLQDTAWITLGGGMNPIMPGRNTDCADLACGGVWVNLFPFALSATLELMRPSTTDVVDRFGEIVDYAANYAITPATAQLGTANPDVARTGTAGRDLATLFAELARTVGGNIYVARDGTLTLELGDHTRPTTVTTTITLEQDDVAGTDRWSRSSTTRPTRVTATSSYVGQVTAVDTAAEASGAVRAAQVETAAEDESQALGVAQYVLNQVPGLSLQHLAVDLVTAANLATWSLCTLEVGGRIRVAGVPSTIYGRTSTDVYVQGWKETWTDTSVVFELDTSPADIDEARYDTARYAADDGAMTVTSGTAVGTTSTGTIVVTTSAGPAITVAPGAYPVTFDWNGEWVTVTSPPASSISPQTLTITARGAAPTVARAHAAGEAFDVANPGRYTI